jgi:hypothetical protein
MTRHPTRWCVLNHWLIPHPLHFPLISLLPNMARTCPIIHGVIGYLLRSYIANLRTKSICMCYRYIKPGPNEDQQHPPNTPLQIGMDVNIWMFLNSIHAGDNTTWWSHTGFIIYLNMTPTVWHSKKRVTVKTSAFGAEFVAMKQCMEALRGLWYKIWMMGVSVARPSYIYVDNMSVIHNTHHLKLTLKKKSNSICYHAMHEYVAILMSLLLHMYSW